MKVRIKEIGMAVEKQQSIIVNNWGIETELTRRCASQGRRRQTLAATTLDPCETVQHDRYEGER